MIDRSHAFPITAQAEVLGLAAVLSITSPGRSRPKTSALMRRLDELHLDFPFAGARMLRDLLSARVSRSAADMSRR